jgi:hypothetical protein
LFTSIHPTTQLGPAKRIFGFLARATGLGPSFGGPSSLDVSPDAGMLTIPLLEIPLDPKRVPLENNGEDPPNPPM